jgi:hypothetical protein
MNAQILVESLIASFPAFFVVFISVFAAFAMRKSSEPPYLKRVAKKYSISPLNLR